MVQIVPVVKMLQKNWRKFGILGAECTIKSGAEINLEKFDNIIFFLTIHFLRGTFQAFQAFQAFLRLADCKKIFFKVDGVNDYFKKYLQPNTSGKTVWTQPGYAMEMDQVGKAYRLSNPNRALPNSKGRSGALCSKGVKIP